MKFNRGFRGWWKIVSDKDDLKPPRLVQYKDEHGVSVPIPDPLQSVKFVPRGTEDYEAGDLAQSGMRIDVWRSGVGDRVLVGMSVTHIPTGISEWGRGSSEYKLRKELLARIHERLAQQRDRDYEDMFGVDTLTSQQGWDY